jgi:hypothetical protein
VQSRKYAPLHEGLDQVGPLVSHGARAKLIYSTKVSTTLHAALTNLLVFHAFLDENPNYRATRYGYENRTAPEIEEVGETAMAEQDGEIAAASGPATASDWGLQFPDLIESDMTDGSVIRERLTKLLDHPGLTNHLLRAKNLLPLLVSTQAMARWPCTEFIGVEKRDRSATSTRCAKNVEGHAGRRAN